VVIGGWLVSHICLFMCLRVSNVCISYMSQECKKRLSMEQHYSSPLNGVSPLKGGSLLKGDSPLKGSFLLKFGSPMKTGSVKNKRKHTPDKTHSKEKRNSKGSFVSGEQSAHYACPKCPRTFSKATIARRHILVNHFLFQEGSGRGMRAIYDVDALRPATAKELSTAGVTDVPSTKKVTVI